MGEKRELVIDINAENKVKEDILTIPNILSVVRLLLIPFFVYEYVNQHYGNAALLVAISGFTDFLDGQIARRCNMITKIGKILDPVADKLTQCAMIACLATLHIYAIPVILLFVGKEVTMGVLGAVLMKQGKMLNGAMWYGKVCTAVLFVIFIILIFFPGLPESAVNALLLLCVCLLVFSLVQYILIYWKIFKNKN